MKPKVAFYWCASCGGCDEAIVDLGEELLPLTDAVDIVFWPVALDFKESDVAAMPDGSILASFINGAVRTTEQEKMARLLRAKSQLVVAFGACAQLGGVPALANLWNARAMLDEVYGQGGGPNQEYRDDGCVLKLPAMYDTVAALDHVVPVDYYIPGCPPTPNIIRDALGVLLGAELPAKGTVLAPDHAMCEECPRKDSRPQDLALKQFRRVYEQVLDPAVCILAQGVPCLGPATRGGCGALCVRGNMPCTGCFGPTSRVRDFGGKAVSAMASLIDSNDETGIERTLNGIPDPVGSFYRYSLPSSFRERKRTE